MYYSLFLSLHYFRLMILQHVLNGGGKFNQLLPLIEGQRNTSFTRLQVFFSAVELSYINQSLSLPLSYGHSSFIVNVEIYLAVGVFA